MADDRLTSALVADALDGVGLRGRCLGPAIRMLSGEPPLVGHALTASTAPIAGGVEPDDLYAGLKAVLHRLGPGDVLVLATDRSDDYATWGELTSTAALLAGAAGIVTDGLVRDIERVALLGFGLFARGTRPVDIGGRAEIVRIGEAAVIDDVAVETGDLIVADRDGVVVVPRAVEARVSERALGKAIDERRFHEALAAGVPIWEAFERFHTL
jgi:4-hydroxy-4-methyl-2-oxoglutarate aldolase